MKVVFASHGSLGDLVPFLEIGKVLVGRGHRVSVATHPCHGGAVAAAGLDFAPMRPDRPSDPSFHSRYMNKWRGPGFVYNEHLIPAIAQSDEDLTAAVEDADILVSVTLALAAPIVAARTGIPWRSTAFQPAMFYSAYDPPKLPLLPLFRGRVDYNAWMLQGARTALQSWAEPLATYRRDQGLGEYHDHPVFGGQHSPDGVLALYSPLFGTVPQDAPRNTIQTGQVLQTGGGQLDDEVAAFLSAGERPLVFTLGSASSHTAHAFFRHGVTMARRLKMRALLLVGRPENLEGLPQHESILAAVKAPYQDVFPHAQVVVHQGGIGTIALALTSGAPMLLVPFAHDQPDNCARAARAGVAKVIPSWRFGPSAARTVRHLCADGAMRLRVAQAGAAMRAERGADRAASAIIAAAQQGRRTARTAKAALKTPRLTQTA